MTVLLNGEPRELATATELDHLLREEFPNLPATGIAVALNGEVVPRRQWAETLVSPDDKIEVLHAIGGG